MPKLPSSLRLVMEADENIVRPQWLDVQLRRRQVTQRRTSWLRDIAVITLTDRLFLRRDGDLELVF